MSAAPPFEDTSFPCRDIIRAADPTAFTGLTYVGEGERDVWDWRVNGGTRLTFVLPGFPRWIRFRVPSWHYLSKKFRGLHRVNWAQFAFTRCTHRDWALLASVSH